MKDLISKARRVRGSGSRLSLDGVNVTALVQKMADALEQGKAAPELIEEARRVQNIGITLTEVDVTQLAHDLADALAAMEGTDR